MQEASSTLSLVETDTGDGPTRLVVVDGPDQGLEVVVGAEWVGVGTAPGNGLQLRDRHVSKWHCEVQGGPHATRVRDAGSRNGVWFEGARVGDVALPPGSLFKVGKTWLQLVKRAGPMRRGLSERTTFGGLVGQSRVMRVLFHDLERVARVDAPVLLQGPTGSGKEVAARAIHEASRRAQGPFVVVDCGATPPELMLAALFGHTRGAFTGAQAARKGAFAQAEGGTLFIDEIAALPLELQPALLRACDRSEIRPLGADGYERCDVRLIAATREDLTRLTVEHRFREDLYHRLNVVSVTLPALQERREDLALLTEAILTKLGAPGAVGGDNLGRLLSHHWPGNVRELENVLHRARTLAAPGAPFEQWSLQFDRWPEADDTRLSFQEQKARVLGRFERAFFTELLQRAGGSIKLASRLSGIERSQLKRLLGKRGLR